MYKVMIVDDEPLMLEGMRLMIHWEDYGFTLTAQASSAAEALRLLKKEPVDLLFTDISMPDMNGVELSEHCRRLYPQMLIAYFSGHQSFSYVQAALRVNAIGYLLKPIDPDAVHELLRTACNELCRRAQRMNPAMQRTHVFRRMAGGETSFLTCAMAEQLLNIEADTLCACALLQRADGQNIEKPLRIEYPRTEETIPVWVWSDCLALVLLADSRQPVQLSALQEEWEARLKCSLVLCCGPYAMGGRGLGESLRTALTQLRQAAARQDIPEAPAEAQPAAQGLPAIVEALVSSIRTEYAGALSLQTLAEQHGMNAAYLGQLFRQHTGKSFNQSLLERRMQVAGALLRETQLPVKSVALEVGIRDASSFSVQFRKFFGLSPLDYRRGSTDDPQV